MTLGHSRRSAVKARLADGAAGFGEQHSISAVARQGISIIFLHQHELGHHLCQPGPRIERCEHLCPEIRAERVPLLQQAVAMRIIIQPDQHFGGEAGMSQYWTLHDIARQNPQSSGACLEIRQPAPAASREGLVPRNGQSQRILKQFRLSTEILEYSCG